MMELMKGMMSIGRGLAGQSSCPVTFLNASQGNAIDRRPTCDFEMCTDADPDPEASGQPPITPTKASSAASPATSSPVQVHTPNLGCAQAPKPRDIKESCAEVMAALGMNSGKRKNMEAEGMAKKKQITKVEEAIVHVSVPPEKTSKGEKRKKRKKAKKQTEASAEIENDGGNAAQKLNGKTKKKKSKEKSKEKSKKKSKKTSEKKSKKTSEKKSKKTSEKKSKKTSEEKSKKTSEKKSKKKSKHTPVPAPTASPKPKASASKSKTSKATGGAYLDPERTIGRIRIRHADRSSFSLKFSDYAGGEMEAMAEAQRMVDEINA